MKTFMNKILSRRLLLILSLIAAAIFGYIVFQLQIIPLKYYIPAMVIIAVIIIALYFGESDKHGTHTLRVTLLKLVNVLLAIVLIAGSIVASKGEGLLASFTGGKEQTIEMDVIVLESSTYQELNDLKGLKFGGNTVLDAININKAETKIEDKIDIIDVTKYTTYDLAIQGLKKSDVAALIIKAVDLEGLEDIEKDFNKQVRIIEKIELTIPSVEANSAKVTQEPFNMLISGTDQEGPINTFALSDVNMVATINPVTKQVLLTTIPRDYFVDIIGMDGVSGKDKLTHSAKGGIACTQQTIENVLGIKFNYYAKFNFTSFMNVVDALGGITVKVPKYEVYGNTEGIFKTKKGNYTIKPGKNEFNARQALSFVRERKSFLKGDIIRGENQMLMVKAIIKKCCSPAIITKMDTVFSSIAKSFETNMSSRDVKSLINMQIDDMSSWDIQSYHLDGDGNKRSTILATVGDVTKTNAAGLYVMEPNLETIEQAKEYISVVTSGEILKVNDQETDSKKDTSGTTTQTKKKK